MSDNNSRRDAEFALTLGDLTACDWCKQQYVVTAEMLDEPDFSDESWSVHNAIPTCPYCFDQFKRALGLTD